MIVAIEKGQHMATKPVNFTITKADIEKEASAPYVVSIFGKKYELPHVDTLSMEAIEEMVTASSEGDVFTGIRKLLEYGSDGSSDAVLRSIPHKFALELFQDWLHESGLLPGES